MKSLLVTVSLLLLAFQWSSCAGAGSRSSDDDDSSFELREFREVKLNNGLTIFFIPDDSLPRVSFKLLVRNGANADPDKRRGLNSLVAEMIGRETNKYSAEELSDQFAGLGTSFSSSSAIEYTAFSTSGLSIYREQLLELFAHTVSEPRFNKKEVERARQLQLAAIKKQTDRPQAFIGNVLRRQLHGDHPYGIPHLGFAEDVKSIKRRDIIRHYLRYYRPNNSFLAVVGKLPKEFETQVTTRFMSWEQREIPGREVAIDRVARPSELLIVNKPDLQQTQIRVGQLGIARSDENFLVARAANTVLGGAFVSRLNSRIRDELGLSYGASSYFSDGSKPRDFVVSTFTKHESVGQVLSEIKTIVANFVDKGVTQEELNAAKALMKGRFPQAIETVDSLALNLMLTRAWGVSDDYLEDYIDDVDDIELDEVNSFIKSFFTPDQMIYVIFTTNDKVKDQLTDWENQKLLSYKDAL